MNASYNKQMLIWASPVNRLSTITHYFTGYFCGCIVAQSGQNPHVQNKTSVTQAMW